MARTSARSSVDRDQSSSPPVRPSRRPSPVGRITRSRSQSVELGSTAPSAKATQRGRKRQAVVESLDGDASNMSSIDGRPRKKMRATAAAARDLSIVAEERVPEAPAHGSDVEEVDDLSRENLSQMSGITTISGRTNQTTHSEAEIKVIEDDVSLLPDLLREAQRLLGLLAPEGTAKEDVESTLRDLQTPGSLLAKKLRRAEERFGLEKKNFGNDHYINVSFVLRKLLGAAEPGDGNFRPDSILHVANLALLLKEFLVVQPQSEIAYQAFKNLDRWFPTAFIRSFDADTKYGKSALLAESFEIGLEIRTYCTIVALRHFSKLNDDRPPSQILTEHFYHTPAGDISDSQFEKIRLNGQLKNILGIDNTADQDEDIHARIETISSFLHSSPAAQETGDLIDFEGLDKKFPWLYFIVNLVQWTQFRQTEIDDSIMQQGDIKGIVQDLKATLDSIDFSGGSSSGGSQSSSIRVSDEKARQGRSTHSGENVEPTRPSMDELDPKAGDEGEAGKNGITQVLELWNSSIREKNKENIPQEKRSLLDRQEGAEQLAWPDSQEFIDTEPTRKRRHGQGVTIGGGGGGDEDEDEDEDEQSDREGFQEGERVSNSSRRIRRPGKQRRVETSSAPAQELEEVHRDEQAIARLDTQPRRLDGAQRAHSGDERAYVQEELVLANLPEVAHDNAALVRAQSANRRVQTRTPWSLKDQALLVDSIAEYGCSWAIIAKQKGWERAESLRGQVAIKDKARNLKVSFLKAGVDLPPGFDEVALGVKEKRSVRAVRGEDFDDF